MSEAVRKRRAGRKWRHFLLMYTLAFLILGALSLFLLWKYYESYEASRPRYAAETYTQSMTEDDWLAAALAAPALKETEFEDIGTLVRDYFETNCRGRDFTCRELAGVSTEKAPVYQVCADKSGICLLYLEPNDAVGFGFTDWKVQRVTAGLSLPSVSLEITAPADERISVNGTELTSAYIEDDHVLYRELTPLEHRFDKDMFMVRYRVDGLYGAVTVTDSHGKRLYPTAASAQSDILCYEVGTMGEYSFRAVAPADFTIELNGAALGKAEETERSVGMSEGLESFLNGYSMETVTYTARGLHSRPELVVTPPPGVDYVSDTLADGTIVYRRAPVQPSEEQRRVAAYFFPLAARYAADDPAVYDALSAMLLRAGTFYRRFWEFAPELESMGEALLRGETPEYGDFTEYGTDCFTCRARVAGECAEILFVRTDGVWIAAGMEKTV